MNVYWVEQSLSNVPAHDEWLAESELTQLEPLRIPKRRADWRLGRWTAKHAVAAVLRFPSDDMSLENIEILSGPSGAPEAYVCHRPALVSISLSHRDGVAACAIAQATIPLGCDLELIETRTDAFVADYFTADEQTIIGRVRENERDQLVTTLWSAKESVLKALRVGLRVDTRSVNICLEARFAKLAAQPDDERADHLSLPGCSAEWHSFHATFQNDQMLYGCWNASSSLIRTFASVESAKPPIALSVDNVAYSPCGS